MAAACRGARQRKPVYSSLSGFLCCISTICPPFSTMHRELALLRSVSHTTLYLVFCPVKAYIAGLVGGCFDVFCEASCEAGVSLI